MLVRIATTTVSEEGALTKNFNGIIHFRCGLGSPGSTYSFVLKKS
jgi:hypothetical protein